MGGRPSGFGRLCAARRGGGLGLAQRENPAYALRSPFCADWRCLAVCATAQPASGERDLVLRYEEAKARKLIHFRCFRSSSPQRASFGSFFFATLTSTKSAYTPQGVRQ